MYFPGRFGGFGRSAESPESAISPESALRQNQRFGGIGGIGGIGSLGGIGRISTELLVLISGSAVRRNWRFGGIDARAGGRAGWRTDEERTDGRTAKKRKTAAIEPSCSGFVLLLGLDTSYSELKHHNIFFSNDYRLEFQQIFDEKTMPEDPTIYIANTSFSNAEHAPEGGSNLFILINAPYLSEQVNWDTEKDVYRKKIIRLLEDKGLSGLSSHIKFQKVITPRDFYDLYASNKGSIYGTSSNDKFSAFVRPRNKSRQFDNLYFVGGSTHPGGGIPLVIQSAFNAVKLIDRYE